MKFLEKDLICIDLDGVDTIDKFRILIKKIENYGIKIEDSMWKLKVDLNVSKIFLHKKSLEIIFIEVSIFNKKHIGLYPFISEKLMSMESMVIQKKSDVDSILEKISSKGIESLSNFEKRILKNAKK